MRNYQRGNEKIHSSRKNLGNLYIANQCKLKLEDCIFNIVFTLFFYIIQSYVDWPNKLQRIFLSIS